MTKTLHQENLRSRNSRRTCARLIVLFAFVLHGICLPAHLALHEHVEPEAHRSAQSPVDAAAHGQQFHRADHHHGDHAPHSALDHTSGPIAWRKVAPPITIDLLAIAVVAQWTTEMRSAHSASGQSDSQRSRQSLPIPFPRGPPATA